MKPVILLITSFLISAGVLKLANQNPNLSFAGRIAMACMLIFTAVGHFAFTKGMAGMVPGFLPFKTEIVILTGILEILFAVGLVIPGYRYFTGWVLIVFFILILPANIKASVDNLNFQTGEYDGPGLTYLWFRVPLQIFFILWVYISTIKN